MQRNPRYFGGKTPHEDAYELGGYAYDSTACGYYNYGAPAPSAFGAPVTGAHEHHDCRAPLKDIEFRPTETCPRNYVIFDQTYHKSRVMFHPSVAHTFGSPGFDIHGTHTHEAGKSSYGDNDEETEDIDALLSSEDGEDDDDVVSTGRTPDHWASNSANTASSSQVSCSTSGKREKMKKMVKTLKGIIPGGDRMDTPAVLDEAVKYLKSLKVEVKKLGIN